MAKTPNQTPAAPVLSPARQMLAEVIAAQGRARAIADKASKVVEAAAAAVEQARAEAANADEAHEDSVKLRLDALKGNPAAKNPEQIREARRARLLAKEELTAADETLKAAQQELQDAHGNIARSEKVAASHCVAVISEATTDAIAAWQKDQRGARLRAILGSLIMAHIDLNTVPKEQQLQIIRSMVSQSRLPFGDLEDWKHLQNKVGAALSHNYAPTDTGPSISRSRKYWAQFSEALLADPAAEQPPLPSIAELFE